MRGKMMAVTCQVLGRFQFETFTLLASSDRSDSLQISILYMSS